MASINNEACPAALRTFEMWNFVFDTLDPCHSSRHTPQLQPPSDRDSSTDNCNLCVCVCLYVCVCVCADGGGVV